LIAVLLAASVLAAPRTNAF